MYEPCSSGLGKTSLHIYNVHTIPYIHETNMVTKDDIINVLGMQ